MSRYTKKPDEIKIIEEGGKILGDILKRAAAMVRPGISTAEINDFAEQEMMKAGGRPSFIGYGDRKNPFPAGLCTSINDAVVHGIPSHEDILQEGDIVGLDIGMEYTGVLDIAARANSDGVGVATHHATKPDTGFCCSVTWPITWALSATHADAASCGATPSSS